MAAALQLASSAATWPSGRPAGSSRSRRSSTLPNVAAAPFVQPSNALLLSGSKPCCAASCSLRLPQNQCPGRMTSAARMASCGLSLHRRAACSGVPSLLTSIVVVADHIALNQRAAGSPFSGLNPTKAAARCSAGVGGNAKRRVQAAANKTDEGREGVVSTPDDDVSSSSNSSSTPSSVSSSSSGFGGSLLRFLCPLLSLVTGDDPLAPKNQALEVATSGIASMARLPWGSKVREDLLGGRGEGRGGLKPLKIFEFEACPFCRRVREALSELDLEAEIYPCPKGSARHRQQVLSIGGKEQFPLLVDPNTGVSMYESADIVRYLFQNYGTGAQPSAGLLESTLITGWVPTLVRAGRGMIRSKRAAEEAPEQMLQLFSYENNQFARLVREVLCELELPYLLKNVAKGSPSRNNLLELSGATQAPYLVDPNYNVSVGDSASIIEYLLLKYTKSKKA